MRAGDTYIYGPPEELASKNDRERAAAEKLATEWADFPDIHDVIRSYEARDAPEARFVYALDKIMPLLLIYNHNGYTWKKRGITVKQLHTVKANKIALSPEILPYYDQLHDLLLRSPHLIRP